jgi:mgtE-like transporter
MPVYSFKRILIESYPILAASALISLGAGYLLSANIDKIKAIPFILMMVPPMNGIGGNIGCILGARLASALHLGTVELKFKGQKVLRCNVIASLLMGLIIFSFLAVVYFVAGLAAGLGIHSSIRLMLIFLMAGVILIPLIILSTVILAVVSFKKGLDPDNVVIPLTTSFIDISGVTCLLISVNIIGV